MHGPRSPSAAGKGNVPFSQTITDSVRRPKFHQRGVRVAKINLSDVF